jgi:hypothetical protein
MKVIHHQPPTHAVLSLNDLETLIIPPLKNREADRICRPADPKEIYKTAW